MERLLELPERYDHVAVLGQLAVGRHDPCARWLGGAFHLAARTPAGPGTLALRRTGQVLHARAYGPAAGWLLARADAIAGLRDDLTGFAALAAAHPLIARLAREHAGLRFPAVGMVFGRLLLAICEQKVTGVEAHRAYAAIVRHFAVPAPGPDAGSFQPALLLPPDPAAVAALPYHALHPLGLEQRRADTLRRAAAQARRLEACADSTALTARLTAIRGIGAWTAAEVVSVVFGDPDAVSVGDFHVPNAVCWALAGEPRGTDARMLELLAPFAGHRGRVCRLISAAGISAPRFGPRAAIRDYRSF